MKPLDVVTYMSHAQDVHIDKHESCELHAGDFVVVRIKRPCSLRGFLEA